MCVCVCVCIVLSFACYEGVSVKFNPRLFRCCKNIFVNYQNFFLKEIVKQMLALRRGKECLTSLQKWNYGYFRNF